MRNLPRGGGVCGGPPKAGKNSRGLRLFVFGEILAG